MISIGVKSLASLEVSVGQKDIQIIENDSISAQSIVVQVTEMNFDIPDTI